MLRKQGLGPRVTLGPQGHKPKGIMGLQREQWPGNLAAQVQSPGLLLTCCVTWEGQSLL